MSLAVVDRYFCIPIIKMSLSRCRPENPYTYFVYLRQVLAVFATPCHGNVCKQNKTCHHCTIYIPILVNFTLYFRLEYIGTLLISKTELVQNPVFELCLIFSVLLTRNKRSVLTCSVLSNGKTDDFKVKNSESERCVCALLFV